ncbi:MAG: KpsF/GutQ family sugar-phosphate isomerase [Deltaproteobacteria bacterium]|nr:KpsF/GutQ family sugar-phosphate isomerase [Deltaproteobacteria bacterium]
MNNEEIIEQGREVLKIEAESILNLLERIDENFIAAVEMISRSKGRVIVTGIGKSGLVGKKIAATLTSTGTPAIFLHPVEGLHGDLGIVTKDDVILAISNSGETRELTLIISCVEDLGAPLIAFTGNGNSTLARSSDIVINVGVTREACPFDLAPTSSTTATLAMGDALAVALIKKKQFSKGDFYRYHPGGHLGDRLMARVKDVMLEGTDIPKVLSGTGALDAITELDNKNLGFILVIGLDDMLRGVLTDGDLRRYIRQGVPFEGVTVDSLMTASPKTIDAEAPLSQTIEAMQKDEITSFAVVDNRGRLKGCIHLHDILGRGGTVKMFSSL